MKDTHLFSSHKEQVIEGRKLLIENFLQVLLANEEFADINDDETHMNKQRQILRFLGIPA